MACKVTPIWRTRTSARPQIAIVLVSPRNPLNIGAAARAMSNFGFFDLRLVNAYDVAYEEARSAVGAAELLRGARNYNSFAEAVADRALVVGTTSGNHRDLALPLHALPDAPAIPDGAALVFGSEKFGLSREDLAYCHWLLRIPAREEHASMNLGQAVAVTLYELIRQEREPPLNGPARAAQESLARMELLMTEMLRESGYRLTPSTVLKLRRMIRRLEITPKDSEMWQGMFRQVLWRLRDNRIRYDESSDGV
jgi:TrmH family RNA methyltransferase